MDATLAHSAKSLTYPAVPDAVRTVLRDLHTKWTNNELSSTDAKRMAITALVEAYMTGYNISGLSLGVVADGDTFLAQGFGVTGKDDGSRVDADTVFNIGSTSKAFTGALIASQVDEGLYDWDTPVWSLAKGHFKMMDPFASERVTMRDLMAMRTGLPPHGHDYAAFAQDATREEIVYSLQFAQQTADLRTRFQYSNIGIMTAGFLAGEQKSTTWDALIKATIFDKLGMTRSFTRPADVEATTDNHIIPFITQPDGSVEAADYRSNDLFNTLGPAGTISSCANDMVKWIKFNLNPDGSGIVSRQGLREVHTPQFTLPASLVRFENPLSTSGDVVMYAAANYALGWVAGTYDNGGMVQHNGAVFGVNTQVTLWPHSNVGVFISANRDQVNDYLSKLAMHIADVLNEREPWDFPMNKEQAEPPTAPVEAEEEEEVQAVALPLAKDAYTGTFYHPVYGRVFVAATHDECTDASQLSIQIGQALRVCASHIGNNVFGGTLNTINVHLPLGLVVQVTFQVAGAAQLVQSLQIPFDPDYDPIVFTNTNWKPSGVGYSPSYSPFFTSNAHLKYDLSSWTPHSNAHVNVGAPEPCESDTPAAAPAHSKDKGGLAASDIALLVLSMGVALAICAGCGFALYRKSLQAASGSMTDVAPEYMELMG